MKKIFSILILMLTISFGCKKKHISQSNSELSIKEIDSVFKTISILCGEWEYDKNKRKELATQGVYLTSMSIDCHIKIENDELINQIAIYKPDIFSELGVKILQSTKDIFLESSDSVTISKRKKYYGLVYHKENKEEFLPIKTLNDSLLILVNGKKYQRAK